MDIVSAATSTTSTSKVTITQLNNAASSVNSYYKANKRLPTYVTISNKQYTMPQFLYLMASETSQLNSGSTASITPKNTVKLPLSPTQTLKSGNIQKKEYVVMAKNLRSYIITNNRLPNYLTTTRGKMKFESTVDTYSRILVFYKKYKRLPTYVSISPWTGKTYTISEGGTGGGTTPTQKIITVTPTQLNQALTSLKSFVETRNKMPNTVTVAGQNIYISQFLQLLAQRISNINAGKTSTNMKTQIVYMPTAPTETITSGNVQKTDFISLARTLSSLSSGSRIPNYLNTGRGKIRYESMTYLFLKTITFYNTNKRLPNYVYTPRWTGTAVSTTNVGILRPVYIVSDNITNTTLDNARINAVIAELKKLGITAYNYGIGPNKNVETLQNTSIPINALIVNFYGGACAATINDMGTSWYKSLKDTKKVFLVFTEGATKITGLAWLPRAHDDNFSPETFTGLANPDKYLLNNGYKYYEGYTSSKLSVLTQILYRDATS